MQNLKKYKAVYQDHTVRRFLWDGELWWVAKDVCDVLGYNHTPHALRMLENDEKGVHKVDTLGGLQEMAIVNESGLYSLILSSKRPEAKAFKRWITREVLPKIVRTGTYSLLQAPEGPSRCQKKAWRHSREAWRCCGRICTGLDSRTMANQPQQEYREREG